MMRKTVFPTLMALACGLVALLTASSAFAEQVLLVQTFDDDWNTLIPPAGWRIFFDGDTSYNDWHRGPDSTNNCWPDNPTPFALIDSAPMEETSIDSLITPVLDCSPYNVVTLRCSTYFKGSFMPYVALLLGSTDGENFNDTIFNYGGRQIGPELQTFNLDWAAYQPTVYIAWIFYGNNRLISYWAVDNVTVTADNNTADVGCAGILAPAGVVDSGFVITPQALIRNFGAATASFPVHLNIGPFWTDSVFVESLAGGDSTLVSFTGWTPSVRGGEQVTCYTALPGDVNPANDTTDTSATMRVLDVGTLTMYDPPDAIDSGDVVLPRARVRNHGTEIATFYTYMHIGNYLDSVLVDSIPPPPDPGAERDINFVTWRADTFGIITACCSTAWIDDRYPSDDTIIRRVAVRTPGFKDVEAIRILAPTGNVQESVLVIPTGVVSSGSVDPVVFEAYFSITQDGNVLYLDSTSVTLAPGQQDTAMFPTPWPASPQGACSSHLRVYLVGDANPANDTAHNEFQVLPAFHDVGCGPIIAPDDTVYTGPLIPSVQVRNYGSFTETFLSRFTIGDGGGTVYAESSTISILGPGSSTVVNFPTWQAARGTYVARCTTMLVGDTIWYNDWVDKVFRVDTMPFPDGWHEAAVMPVTPSGKDVKAGGSLTLFDPTRLIYGMKGNKTADFYSYDFVPDAWRERKLVPPGTEGKPVYKGGTLCNDGNRHLFATKGNNTPGFYRYDVVSDSWVQKANVPLGLSNKKVKGGTSTAYVEHGGTGYVYLLKGYKAEFYRYNTVLDTWQFLPDAPPGASPKYDKGSWLCYDGGTGIYCHKAKYHELYRFDLQTGAWGPALTGMPFLNGRGREKKSKDGGSAAWHSGAVYALKGGGTQEFWTYTASMDSWAELETIPYYGSTNKKKAVKDGGAIISFGGNVFFILKGNKCREFWHYKTPSAPPGVVEPESPFLRAARPGSIAVWPSPARGRAFVSLGTGIALPATLRVYDIVGKAVLERAVSRDIFEVDCRSLTPGVYFVRVLTPGRTHSARLTIE